MWQIGEDAGRSDWRVLDTRLSVNLYTVVGTVAGPYAVGGRGTVAANRGDGWTVVFDDGPATRQNQLRAVDVTDDGERLWLVGSGGAMACYDVVLDRKYDFGYPEELTATWEGITVSGPRGGEKALAVDGDGEVLPFVVDGTTPDWGYLDAVAPDGGIVTALGSTPEGVGFVVDDAGSAHKTHPEEGWTDIGVLDVESTFTDVYAGPNEQVYVSADDGHVYRYGDTYHSWTPLRVTEDTAIRTLDVYEGGDGRRQMTALTEDGTVYERVGPDRWERRPLPANARLYDLALGAPDLLVGKSGTVLTRPRGATPSAVGETVPRTGRSTAYEGDADRVDTE